MFYSDDQIYKGLYKIINKYLDQQPVVGLELLEGFFIEWCIIGFYVVLEFVTEIGY